MKVFSFVLLILVVVSCGEDSIKLERKVKFKADSLFQLEYQSIIKVQDSICSFRKQANMQKLIDSIVKVRKQEILQLQKGL